jgi:FAD:protein FMN transferase
MRRRRCLRVLAAGAGLALPPAPGRGAAPRRRWRGAALGAEARIDLWLDDPARAGRLVSLCLAEIDRLERVFSLQRRDSALSTLNREGRLHRPPPELVLVLEAADRVAGLTGGAFDATVQPLWRLYADHFARPGADPAGPPPRAIERAARLVGRGVVEAAPGAVRLARPGAAVTLNGIAQGFIADRLAALLREEGAVSVLLDVGEIATVGAGPGGADWRVRAGPAGPLLHLAGGAVATSSPSALAFDPQRRLPHLLDPSTARPAAAAARVTVAADSAMMADAISTALAVRPGALSPGLARHVRQVVVAGDPGTGGPDPG